MSDTLVANGAMAVDEPLYSADQQVMFVLESDGELALYCRRPDGWLKRWSSNTAGSSADSFILQRDGNLSLRDGASVVWASGVRTPQTVSTPPLRDGRPIRGGGGGAASAVSDPPRLVVQNDENVVIYRGKTAIWSTETSVEGMLVREEGQPEVYLLRNGARELVPDAATVEVEFGGWGNVITIPKNKLDSIVVGPPVISVLTKATNLHMCVDQTLSGPPHPPRQYPPPPPRITADGSVVAQTQQPLVGVTDKMWNVGQVIRVKMMGGTPHIRERVMHYAQEWTQYANVSFHFVDPSESAEIKIAFDSGNSWSKLGRDALWVPFDYATMNFGWLDDNSPESEISRVVLHEFGHALGFGHEHQSPVHGIQWDREKTYAYFLETEDWDRGKVDEQVFNRYSVSQTNYSAFDPQSIMLYYIPDDLTLDGKGTQSNNTLSDTDKEYARLWYPHPPTPQNATGLLRTGDDCDEIDFEVEYGVVDSSQVEFSLKAAAGLDWWKAIEVPIESNAYRIFEIQNGSSASGAITTASIDGSRPIRFWKAKMFGVHTRLGYTWSVLHAIPGGSRISLEWKRDRC